MPGVVAALLIPLLFALPINHVLAQATQTQAQAEHPQYSVVAIPGPADAAAQCTQPCLLAVPTVEPNTPAALLLAAGRTDRAAPSDSLPLLSSAALSGGAKAAVIVGVVLVAVFLVVLAVCGGRLAGCGGD